MTSKYHGDAPQGEIHPAHNWEYPSAATRLAATGFVAADLHKLALQVDDMSLWLLLSTTPSWRRVSSPIYNNRGTFNASSNLFPATGGSGVAGAILADDIWYISVAGTLGATPVLPGDAVNALIDTPLQNAANWHITAANTDIIAGATIVRDSDNGIVGKTSGKINFLNIARTFKNFLTNATTAARTYTFPDKDITVAGLTDITAGLIASGVNYLGITTGSVNTYVASGATIPGPHVFGQIIVVRAALANTSFTPTIDLGNGQGAKNICGFNGSQLWYGDIKAGMDVVLVWNSASWQMMNQPAIKVGSMVSLLNNAVYPGILWCPNVATYVLRSDFPALFACIGLMFGNTNGSNFGLPLSLSGFSEVQTYGSIGSPHTGSVISHNHTYQIGNGTGAIMPDYNPFDGNNGAITATTNNTGGTYNMAAGLQVLKGVVW